MLRCSVSPDHEVRFRPRALRDARFHPLLYLRDLRNRTLVDEVADDPPSPVGFALERYRLGCICFFRERASKQDDGVVAIRGAWKRRCEGGGQDGPLRDRAERVTRLLKRGSPTVARQCLPELTGRGI